MDLFSRFKKDYFNYLLSVILPALIMGLSIPVLKHLLGAKGYGSFAIWFNGVLLFAAILSGWIYLSILRFFTASKNKNLFTHNALRITFITQFIIAMPVFLLVWYLKSDSLFALLFVLALFIICLQFPVLAVSQSGFLSKKNIYSETIRAVSYIGCALLLLLYSGVHYLYALFIAVILSYLLSVLYMYNQIQRHVNIEKGENTPATGPRQLAKSFMQYGAPLSFWFVFAYMTSYIDKLFIIKNFGLEAQGNYQAIFDLLSKTLVVVVSPVATSLFPLLTLAYSKGEITEIRKLLKKIIFFELAGFVLVSVLYWWFGASIVLDILKIEHTVTYKWMGFLVIAGTFVWLIAVVVHKRFELQLQSFFLLRMVAMAFLIQLGIYFIFQKSHSLLLYPMGYFISGLLYLLLVSFLRRGMVLHSGNEEIKEAKNVIV